MLGTKRCLSNKALAGICWAGPRFAAFKQSDAKLRFQELDAPGNSGLRNIRCICCPPKAAMLCYKHGVLQMAEIKGEVWHIAPLPIQVAM